MTAQPKPDDLAPIRALVERWKQYISEEDNDEFGGERKAARQDDIDDLQAVLTTLEQGRAQEP